MSYIKLGAIVKNECHILSMLKGKILKLWKTGDPHLKTTEMSLKGTKRLAGRFLSNS